jgi:aminoglycoside phosphotransferase (APT) family kinase protein
LKSPDGFVAPSRGRAATSPRREVALIQQIVEEHLGASARRVRRNEYGHRSRTFTVELDAETVIVRTNGDAGVFAATSQNIGVLRRLDIPAPEVLAVDLTCSRYPFAYILLKAIPGVDLVFALPDMSQGQQAQVARQVIDFERRTASLPEGRGYGYAGIGEMAPHATWRDAIAFGAFSHGYSPRTIDGALVGRVEKALHSARAYLDQVRPTCFLDDLTTKNVIVEEGALRGVVDFDVVCYGDPLFQVGLTQTAIGFDLPEKCMTYVEHLCTAADLKPDQRRMVDLYAALCGVDFLSRKAAGAERDAGLHLVDGWLERAISA